MQNKERLTRAGLTWIAVDQCALSPARGQGHPQGTRWGQGGAHRAVLLVLMELRFLPCPALLHVLSRMGLKQTGLSGETAAAAGALCLCPALLLR